MKALQGRRVVRATITFAVIRALLSSSASAQEHQGPVTELAAGALSFADDSIVTEGLVGAAARFYILPRVSLGPEIAYIRGENHSHLMLTGNVTMKVDPFPTALLAVITPPCLDTIFWQMARPIPLP